MRAGPPFFVCPWRSDFMESLLERALADTGGDVGSAVFIFPHARPEKYLQRLLRRDSRVKRPLLAPRCLTVSGLFSAFRARIHARSAWNAGLLDRVGLLLECARQEWKETERAFAPPLADARRFFPWGARLASLFEECFVQHRKPENFFNTGGQVSPFAEALLARLAQIYERYAAGLAEREWTTPGFDASLSADWLLKRNELPAGLLAGTVIYIAGFHSLTGSEDLLFRHLWEHRKARVMLHADPALANAAEKNSPGSEAGEYADQVHWSCRAFIDWAKRWNASIQPVPTDEQYRPADEKHDPANGRTAAGKSRRRIRYYEGFDLHSQLTVLERELADLADPPDSGPAEPEQATPFETGASFEARMPLETGTPPGSAVFFQEKDAADASDTDQAAGLPDQAADTVVVLPDSGLLMPTLHHLPQTSINISMGYPLSRSPLFRLLDTLARLQEGRRGEGYYWRDLTDLVRHPYIKMLRPLEEEPDVPRPDRAGSESGKEGGAGDSRFDGMALRRELYRLERSLHEQGRKYADPRGLLEQAYGMLAPEEMPSRPVLVLLDKLLETCLDNFERPGTPRELGQALEKVCSLLLGHGSALWQRFLIDAECLYRLMQSLIPELCRSQLAEEPFPPRTLFAVLRRLMEAERVPFEAAPLVGLQVMGMLETRLLSFRRVVILDAGEDKLPGAPTADPLLPEALRQELGLPPLHAREQVAAYHFFRLLNGAREVVLLWQEGPQAPGIQEGKKKKSRFIEELLWEEEKNSGRLLTTGERGTDGPLTVLASAVAPVSRERRGLAVSPDMRALARSLFERPLSASLLDDYLRCPVRFFYQRLARLTPAEEINEGDDPVAVGNLFHQVLHEGYSRHEGGPPLPGGEALAAALGGELLETLYASPAFAALGRSLPADSFAMLGCAGKARLGHYLERQPPGAVLALERRLTAPFVRNNLSCVLTGKADRIDLRYFPADAAPDGKDGPRTRAKAKGESFAETSEENGPGRIAETNGESAPGSVTETDERNVPGIIILDYKTGRLPSVSPHLWDDREFWQRIRNWRPGPDGAPGDAVLLRDLARLMESVQLPLYLLLHSLETKHPPPAGAPAVGPRPVPALEAAWVALGENGEEKPLFPKDFSLARRVAAVRDDIPELLYFLLRHILESRELLPHPGKHCDWCSCAKLCILPRPSL